MKKLLITGIISTLLFAAGSRAQYHKYDVWEEPYTVQGLLGAVQYESLKLNPEDIQPGQSAEVDLSLLPQLGGAWSTLPQGDRFQYGLETTFLVGFQFDDINYLYLGGGGLYVSLSTSLWMFDFSGGAYASYFLTRSRNLRIYAGGGPLMMYAFYKEKRDYTDSTPDTTSDESAFGIGLYARTGIEFRMREKGMLGMGVRGNWSNVDFSNIGGTTDLTGYAVFVTYTAGF